MASKEPSESEPGDRAMERRALSARDVHEALRAEGTSELERPWNALAWSGLAAGISMGLSLVAEGLLRAHLPDTPWRPLVASLGYTVGFLVVTLGRQQLFTETTLTACLPVLHERTWDMLRKAVRLWVVVLLANLVGTWLFAWAAAHPSAFDPALRQAFSDLAREAVARPPLDALVRGVFGGWIIALMVWLLPSAESARPWVILMMTYLISAAGLTHIIAGSVEVFYGIVAGELGMAASLGRFVLPVLIGNSIGGIVLVAILNHAQVVAEEE
jgi:formate/nitrite transporter FocA (FNT family)